MIFTDDKTARTVVLVDDDPASRYLFREAFEATGTHHQLQTAKDGEELMQSLSEGLSPALVVLDLNMPGMGGHGVLRLLRDTARTKILPVVVFTGTGDPVEIERCYRNGANAVVTKPVRLEPLNRTVDAIVRFWLVSSITPTLSLQPARTRG